MALHAPIHRIGTTPHPHVLRNALAIVVVLIVAVVVATAALTIRMAPSTGGASADKFMTQPMIEFRLEERTVGYPVMPLDYNGPH